MSPEKLADLRRRAVEQAHWGNYWARKTLALLDEVASLDAAYEDLVATNRRLVQERDEARAVVAADGTDQ